MSPKGSVTIPRDVFSNGPFYNRDGRFNMERKLTQHWAAELGSSKNVGGVVRVSYNFWIDSFSSNDIIHQLFLFYFGIEVNN